MTLQIAGVAFDDWLEKASLTHVSTFGSEPDSLTFGLVPLGWGGLALTVPVAHSIVVANDGSDDYFGGVITELSDAPDGFQHCKVWVTCADWREAANRDLMNDRFWDRTPGYILAALFEKYAPEFDRSGIDQSGAAIGYVSFRRDSHLTDVLEALSNVTGWVWDLTPDKRILWAPPGAVAAPFELSDTSRNFEKLSVSTNSAQIRNRVVVRGDRYPDTKTTTDTIKGDGLTTLFLLSGVPYGLDQYEVLKADFTSGIDSAVWVETDVTNGSPPAGHLAADGYLVTTLQQGSQLAESGWLQVLGGNGTWGQVRLMTLVPQARAERRRFEWEVSPTTTTGEGRVGLWDPNNQGALAGELYGVFMDDGVLRPSIGGVVQGATTSTYTAGGDFRVRITLKAAGGAIVQINKDATGDTGLPAEERVAWRASQWVTLLDTATGTAANLTVSAIFNKDFAGRVRRIRAFDRLYSAVITVGGVEKVAGLLGVDEDSGCDALVGFSGGAPVITFFGDTKPGAGVNGTFAFTKALPILLEVRDKVSIAALAALETDPNVPANQRGVRSHYIHDKTLTSVAMASARGTQEVEQFANALLTLVFRTRERGARAGQLLRVKLSAIPGRGAIDNSFLIQNVTTQLESGVYTATITATSRLKGAQDYLLELLKLGKRQDVIDDENSPIEELLYAADELVMSDVGAVGGPHFVAADELVITDLGAVTSGQMPPYRYATCLLSEATERVQDEDGELILTEESPSTPARYTRAAYA